MIRATWTFLLGSPKKMSGRYVPAMEDYGEIALEIPKSSISQSALLLERTGGYKIWRSSSTFSIGCRGEKKSRRIGGLLLDFRLTWYAVVLEQLSNRLCQLDLAEVMKLGYTTALSIQNPFA